MQRPPAAGEATMRLRAGRALRAWHNWVQLAKFWTFRGERGHFAYQGLRFLVVSLVALGANLVCLRLLVALGLGKVAAQAVAIIVVTPLNFVGNKLWSFRR